MNRISQIILAVGLLAGACDHGASAPPPPLGGAQPALIRQKTSPNRVELAALGGGKLVLRDGCWRKEDRDSSRLLLWPPDVSLTPDGRGVIDATTGVTVREGDDIVIGGGEVDGVGGLQDSIPSQCAGPYWLAASGFFPAPQEAWRTTRIGADYSIHAPADLQADGAVLPLTLKGSGLTVRLEIGAEPCSSDLPGGKQWRFQAWSDQRAATAVRSRTQAGDTLEAVFHGVDGPRGTPPKGKRCLRVHADCATSRDCDVARSMISTIRFGDLGTPD